MIIESIIQLLKFKWIKKLIIFTQNCLSQKCLLLSLFTLSLIIIAASQTELVDRSASAIGYVKFIKSTYGKNLSAIAVERGLGADFESRFFEFISRYKRPYARDYHRGDEYEPSGLDGPSEIEYRKGLFLYSLHIVHRAESEYARGRIPYRLTINQFADHSANDYPFIGQKYINENYILNHFSTTTTDQRRQKQENILSNSVRHRKPIEILPSSENRIPAQFDWRTRGVVTPVDDQGRCGSCWIFATLTVVESVNAIARNQTFFSISTSITTTITSTETTTTTNNSTSSLPILSRQELLNCVRPPRYISDGCGGGVADDAYDFVQRFGVVHEQSYEPYSATVTACRNVSGLWKQTISGYDFLPLNATDELIMRTLYRNGPLAAIINAGDSEFMLYSSGVLTSGGSRDLYGDHNHYVTIVGYGTQRGYDYWLIKNSWGVDWGEEGYVKMIRGVNARGINTLVSWARPAPDPTSSAYVNLTLVTPTSSGSERFRKIAFHLDSILMLLLLLLLLFGNDFCRS